MGTGATTAEAGPLAGFVIGVTADRRRDELTALLERRGARVTGAPAMRIVPIEDDVALRRATEACLTRPLDYVVATTGVGWRGWMSAAEGWGHGTRLAELCRAATVLSRGPKATGAVRASGLAETYSPRTEGCDELLAWMLARGVRGRRIAVQEHGAPADGFAAALRDHGAQVIEVRVYRWAPPPDPEGVRRLAEQTARREVHALTFTSAPAIGYFLEAARTAGLRDEVLAALRGDVVPVCVGPLCARPLEDLGVAAVRPERGRLGALVRTLTETLPARGRRELRAGGRDMALQGSALLVGGESIWLPPVPAALLRALAERPGRVLSRPDLLRRVWADPPPDEHAVEAAVARLRQGLGAYAGLVRTVPKRGYRLAVDG
ncbi:uroporphyrinogen-III synthase [Streptomyces albireticuli]|uniref:Uroporphyrinogen-III synthase n=1 Tax=Streptomyces albireticuli TaxID=1940 RepID=A0A2A2D8E3_9ACTN|nr:uroporphyrinogen-III synthase [Streptomyces albireticuli]MCD9194584.1 uroporphyrinogen-III synthase [Streptomyces albireticuli]PAU47785.1 uroporphyrinogen-III synthase [Streptomyces albireticuli]